MIHELHKEWIGDSETIKEYDKGYSDGWNGNPIYESPDYARFDNLRRAYAIGRKEGEINRKKFDERNGTT